MMRSRAETAHRPLHVGPTDYSKADQLMRSSLGLCQRDVSEIIRIKIGLNSCASSSSIIIAVSTIFLLLLTP